MPVYKNVNKGFFKKWSPEMAYVLGFFAADGTMIENKRGAHFIEFYSTDLDVIRKIKKHFQSDHKISKRVRGGNCKVGYRLQIGSLDMFFDLKDLGFMPNKSLRMQFPKIPTGCLPHFVRGYFDGDGCISMYNSNLHNRRVRSNIVTCRFTSGSKDFLLSLHSSLKKIVNGGYIIKKKNGAFELVFSHLDSLALYRFLYNNIQEDLCLERKRRKFQEVIKIKYPQFV